MWSDKVEFVKLQKEDKGLGFSILDYQVRAQHTSIHLNYQATPLSSLRDGSGGGRGKQGGVNYVPHLNHLYNLRTRVPKANRTSVCLPVCLFEPIECAFSCGHPTDCKQALISSQPQPSLFLPSFLPSPCPLEPRRRR